GARRKNFTRRYSKRLVRECDFLVRSRTVVRKPMKKTRVPVGRPFLLRYTNALSILHLLREAGACSRADLVRASGLSAPTVTNVVAWLESAGLIAPLGA